MHWKPSRGCRPSVDRLWHPNRFGLDAAYRSRLPQRQCSFFQTDCSNIQSANDTTPANTVRAKNPEAMMTSRGLAKRNSSPKLAR
jgi:hypothetical protein